MKPVKTFNVFGEQVDVIVNGEMSNGASALIVQTTAPGGGPPPHSHRDEDEIFTVLEGDFAVLDNGQWRKASIADATFAPRNFIHTSRNAGTTLGRAARVIAPAADQNYSQE